MAKSSARGEQLMALRRIRVASARDVSAGPAKAVLRAIDDHAGPRCTASVETLADEIQFSERTVRRAIDALEEQGYISTVRRDGKCHEITIVWDRVYTDSASYGTPDTQSDPTPDTQSGTPDTQSGTPDTQSVNPGLTVRQNGTKQIKQKETSQKGTLSSSRENLVTVSPEEIARRKQSRRQNQTNNQKKREHENAKQEK